MPSIADVSVDLKLHTKQFVAELDASRVKMRGLSREAGRVESEMRTPMERYEQRIVKLNAMLELGKVSQETYGRAAAVAKTKLDEETAALQRLTPAFMAAEQAAARHAAAQAQAATAAAKMVDTLRREAAQITALLHPEREHAANLQRLAAMLKIGALSQRDYNAAVLQARSAYAAANMVTAQTYSTWFAGLPKLQQLKVAMTSVAGATEMMKLSMVSAAAPLAMMVAPIMLIMGFKRLVGQAEDFNRALHSSTAIMGDLSKSMTTDMRNKAFQVARETIYSPEELAKGYYYLTSAGLDAKQSLEALGVVAEFGQAGMFDLSRATELLGDALNGLRMQSKDPLKNLAAMTLIGDTLVKANTLANASVEEFATGLAKASGVMTAYRISLSEGVSMLAALAPVAKGEEAATAMMIVLRELQNAALNNADAFERLGKKAGVAFSVFDKSGEIRPMAAIMRDMETVFATMSTMQRKQALTELGFTDKSVKYVLALVGTSGKLQEYNDILDNVGGTMEDVAANQLTDFQKGWEAIKSLVGDVTDIGVTPWVNSIGNAMEGFGKSIGGVIDKWRELKKWMIPDEDTRNTLAKAWERSLRNNTPGGQELGFAKDMIETISEWFKSSEAAKLPAAGQELQAGAAAMANSMTLAANMFDNAKDGMEILSRKWGLDRRSPDFMPMANQAEFAEPWKEFGKNLDASIKQQAEANRRRIGQEKNALIAEARAMDPLLVFVDELKHIERLRAEGLSDELATRATKEAQQTAVQGLMGDNKPVDLQAAMQEGSAAAYRAIVKSQVDARDPALQAAKQQVEEARRGNGLLRDIRDNVKPPQPVNLGAA